MIEVLQTGIAGLNGDSGKPNIITGTAKRDEITGTAGRDLIDGKGGYSR